MKKWKLKKDLPCYKAGTMFFGDDTNLKNCDASAKYSTEFFPLDTRSEWLEEVGERWEPEIGVFYYLIGYKFLPIFKEWHFDDEDLSNIKNYNCFRTREQAEECAKLCLETRKKYTESLNKS